MGRASGFSCEIMIRPNLLLCSFDVTWVILEM
jgi:hypothetical protein